MLSKNNQTLRIEKDSVDKVPHYGLRKLSVGVASVLLGTTAGLAMMGSVSHADTVDADAGAAPAPAPAATVQAVPQATTQQATQQTVVPDAVLSTTQVPAPSAPSTPGPQATPSAGTPSAGTQTANVTPATQSMALGRSTVANNVNALYGASLVQSNPVSHDSGYVNYNLETGESTPVPSNNQPQPVLGTPPTTPLADSNIVDKQEQWNITVGYNWATKNFSDDNGVTIYAVPGKAGQAAADATKMNIKLTDRNPGSHNELTVTTSGNTVAGQPVVDFVREYDGTEGSITDPTAIAASNAKGHHYTVYHITLPLQTDFGWQYQQPTTAFNAEVILDHVNNGVTIDHSKDIQDSVDVYQYANQIKFDYVSDDGKINRIVAGPLLQSSDPRKVEFNYNIPQGYKLKNSDQVVGAGFEESQSQPGMPVLAHYGSQGWPANDTNPNETIVEVPLTLAAVKSSWTGQFIDQDNHGVNVGNPVVVNGNSGDTEHVAMTIPANYELAKGATIPTSVTLTDNPQTAKIPLVHKHQLITKGNNPDPSKYNVSQIITRTINVHNPSGKVDTTKQNAELTRTGDLDLVTQQIVYTPWTTGNWGVFTTPTVQNYKPSLSGVMAQTVKHGDKDQTIDITYQAESGSWTGQFVDTDNHDAPVGSAVTIAGNTGTTGQPKMTIPDGYELVPGQSVPTSVTFTNAPQAATIGLRHKTHVVHPGDPDAGNYDLVHAATRTINLKGLDKVKNAPKGTAQKAEVSRTATVDDVTKKVLSYSPWSKASWASYQAPKVDHYAADPAAVAGMTVDETTKDAVVDINYKENVGSWTGQFIDLDNNNAPVGAAVTIAGNAGTTGQPKLTVPTGYELAPGQTVPTSVTFTDGPQTVTIGLKHKTHTVKPGDPDAGNYDLVHDATRTINLKGLDKVKNAPKGDVQKAEVSRTVTVDDVTKKVLSYSPWSKAVWASYQAPKVDHYTATPGSIAEAAVNETTKDTTVDINYQEVVGSWTGQFIDTDDNNKPVGKPVTISGEEGSTGTPTMKIPAGYELVPGQSIPTSVTFTNAPKAVTIGLKHKTHTVKPGDPDAGNFDLVHYATRTINFKGLDKVANAPKAEQQKAEVTRTAVVDDVTKQAVSYTPWTTSSWAKYDAPKIDGYKATPASIAEAKVTNETKDTSVDIVYVSDEGSWTGQFVDGDENNKLVGNPVTVAGKEGTNQKINMPIPDGYELAPGQSIPSSAIMTNGPVQAQIVLKHKHELVNAGDPDAKTYNLDLKKAVTRTIEFKGLDDKLDPVVQKVVLLRSADVDLVTKQAVYTNWSTDQWQKFDVPSVDGYTPDKTVIDAENVNGDTQDQLVVVTYHQNNDNKTPETPVRDTTPAPSEGIKDSGTVAAQPAAQSAVAASPVLAAAAPVAAMAAPAPAAPSAAGLPQTGNDKSAALTALGLAMASITLGSALLKKREA